MVAVSVKDANGSLDSQDMTVAGRAIVNVPTIPMTPSVQ